MQTLTLHRQAPVAPDATECRLCDAPIEGTLQDHLLTGQPGTSHVQAAICQRCGGTLQRLVAIFGPELHFIIHERSQPVDRLIGGPAARSAVARGPADHASSGREGIEATRHRLAEEADTLARTERTLRAEADKLAGLGGGEQKS